MSANEFLVTERRSILKIEYCNVSCIAPGLYDFLQPIWGAIFEGAIYEGAIHETLQYGSFS